MVNEMGERILVVDDDREIVKAIDILLRKEGYEVLKAYDGLEALDILSREQKAFADRCDDAEVRRLVGGHAHPGKTEHPYYRPQCKERGERQGTGIVHGRRRLCGETL